MDLKSYINKKGIKIIGDIPLEDLIRSIWKSVRYLAIATMQDLLDLRNESRMNLPSTMGINW